MNRTIQARLDDEGLRALAHLKRLGWSPSNAVREGLRLLSASHPHSGRPRIIGLGGFSSGVRDLASNKKHLREFGK